MVPYSMTKRLITIAVTGTEENDDYDNEALIYVKELKKKKMWITEGHARKRNMGWHDYRDIGYQLRKCEIFKKL